MSDKKRLNCPNCAAPITGIKCEYCGTQFLDFALIDMDSPFYIRVKQGSNLITCKVKVDEFNVRSKPPEYDILYTDGIPFYKTNISSNQLDMELKMKSVAYGNDDILCEVMEVKND